MPTISCVKCNRAIEAPSMKVAGIELDAVICGVCDDCYKSEMKKYEERKKTDKIDRLLQCSGIPKPHLKTSLSTIDKKWGTQNKIINYIKYWHPDKEDWKLPFLFGPPGTGKTILSYCLINKAIIEYQIEAIFSSSTTFMHTTREEFLAEYNKKIKAKILVLDDIGASMVTSWSLEALYTLLDTRLKNKLPTMITSNIDPTKLAESLINLSGKEAYRQICSSIGDRIFELCHLIKLGGTSIRLEKALEEYKHKQW